MTNKKATFEMLDTMETGQMIRGWDLRAIVYRMTGKMLYPATALRYLRIWRSRTGKQMVCVSKPKSMYQLK